MNAPLQVILGDITRIPADAIVNAANTTLLGGGGVDGAIHRAAGPELLEECRALKGCKTGEAKITKGYRLPARYGGAEARGKATCCGAAIKTASASRKEYRCRTVAFPSISTGVYRYPLEQAAEVAVSAINSFFERKTGIEEVVIVCFDARTQKAYLQAVRQ